MGEPIPLTPSFRAPPTIFLRNQSSLHSIAGAPPLEQAAASHLLSGNPSASGGALGDGALRRLGFVPGGRRGLPQPPPTKWLT